MCIQERTRFHEPDGMVVCRLGMGHGGGTSQDHSSYVFPRHHQHTIVHGQQNSQLSRGPIMGK